MKKIISLEEAALTAAAIYLIAQLNLSLPWWMYFILFFSPDISMLGYLLGNTAGAIAYNVFHHRSLALIIAIAGFTFGSPYIILAGLILFGHSSMDRMFGFGLKYFSGFKNTHLGNLR